MTLDLQLVPRPAGGSPLLEDYLGGAGSASGYYFGHPGDIAAYRRKAAEVDTRFDADRRRAAVSLLRPVSAAAATQLRRVESESGFLVTTGQQAGLFGGPLLTIYKALTAVRLAAALEAALGRPVAAVFWVASEDHDWDEVRRTVVFDRHGRPAVLELPGEPHAPPASMARRALGEEVLHTIDRLAATLPDTAHAAALVAQVRRAYVPGRSVADAFTELLGSLLAEFPISLLQASDAALKALSVPVLRAGLLDAEAHGNAVVAQTERLARHGYPVTVPVVAGATNVLWEDAAGRERLLRAGAGWQLRRTKRRFSDEDLLERLEQSPGDFSPNVLLRPVVESAVLPTLCYVGGPAETSYFAQIGCLFRACGLEPPIVKPRAGFTLVEAKVRKVLDRFGLEPADTAKPLAALRAAVIAEALPEEVSRSIAALREALGSGWSEVAEAARSVDATLDGPLRAMLLRNLDDVAAAERKIAQHYAARNETRLRQLERAVSALHPEGVPQERSVNVLSFLAHRGPELLHAIHDAVEITLDPVVNGWRGPECDRRGSSDGG